MTQADVDLELTAIQAHSFAFLMGFLPNLAYQQFQAAKKYGLINDLGRPDVSSFAAYAYSAGLHTDNDICASHGWVFKRSKEVLYISKRVIPRLSTYIMMAFNCRSKGTNPTLCMVITASSLNSRTTATGFGTLLKMHMARHPIEWPWRIQSDGRTTSSIDLMQHSGPSRRRFHRL
jgi:hypothetical protein